MISKATIQRITDEARVEDVVGEFVTLKKRGANLLGLCPFHNEKTPSFNVNPARNIYKCFGCGKAGGPVQFLIDYQQLSYPDALRYLAKKYNIEIDEEQRTDEEKQQEQEKHNLTESIYIANGFAQKYFTDYMLHTEEGKIGLAYFKERGFMQQTIEKFQLGFAPDTGDGLTKHALKNGYQLDVLKKAGLTSPKENSTYDFFRNRVMFPIHNMMGKVAAFGGRIMVKDPKAPKYVNTPESEVYQKSKILYGIYFAKQEMRRKDVCLLVEGYTDVISLHQAGIENAVASSGTALTPDQIRLIKRITPNITMLYDGDAAGLKAAMRGTDLILEEGMNVRVVVLPDAEDPDSYVRKTGADGFEKFISENNKDLILFIAQLYAEEARRDPIRKAEVMRDVVGIVAKIPDALKRSIYIRECSQIFKVDEQVLITETNKSRQKRQREQSKEEEKQAAQQHPFEELPSATHKEQMHTPTRTLPVIEREIIRLFVDFGNWGIQTEEGEKTVTAYMLEELDEIQIETPPFKQVFELIKREFAEGRVNDDKFYTNHDDELIRNTAIEVITEKYELSENWWNKYKIVIPEKKHTFIRDIQSTITRLKQYVNYLELRKMEAMINALPENAPEREKLIKLYMVLQQQKMEFARELGTVIYRPVI